ncbi:PREDICTED: uncharacterized protein LOC106791970 [Polistes canadensis]|uniref:uncharacterized protein LOC106791970 n=1 Tax=Polistes canadensis TaxID=91411 RepID=UPI000718FF6E|nr:PREDICTED: uncharacterized protein LOC106791970 [Polistes canadensis]
MSCKSEIQFYRFNQLYNATEQLIDTLSNCMIQRKRFVTLLSDTKESIGSSSKLFNIFTVLKIQIPISNDSNLQIFDHDISKKTEIILAIVSNPLTLRYFLTKLKKSKWWNLYGLYLIIDAKTLEKGCDRAYDFLQIIWKQDILSSTYFCINSNEEIMMYTYNPYTNWALKEWKEVWEKPMNVSSNRNWTLYEQKFINNKTTCSNLDFPKTLTLGGKEIKAIAISLPPSLVINPNKTGYENYHGVDGNIAKTLWNKLNASLQVTITNDTAQSYFGYSKSNQGIFDIINSGKKDILLNSQYIFNKYMNVSFTYCHINTGISLLSRYAGYETGPSKILNFMNPKLILGTILVFCATIIIFVIARKEGIVFAFLEVLRIVIGATIIRKEEKTSLRIYLITVVLLFLITGALFQGSLSSLLTSPVQKSNIDCIDDLKNSGYEVYIFRSYQNIIFDEEIRSRLKFINHWNCTKYVLEQEDVGCAAERLRLMKIGFENHLHVSKHRLITLYSAYVVRPNWPLNDRVSNLLQRMWQCGLIRYWVTETAWNYKPEWLLRDQNIMKENNNYRSLTLADLAFVFYILLFGFIASILAFFLERFDICSKKEEGSQEN